MPILTPIFEQTFHEASPIVCGTGSLPAGNTLILVVGWSNDAASYAPGLPTLNGIAFDQDGYQSVGGGGDPAVKAAFYAYRNYTTAAIDLADAITLIPDVVQDFAVAVKAFVVDGIYTDSGNTASSNQISGYVQPNTLASDDTNVDLACVATYDDPLDWNFVEDANQNTTTTYTAFGIVDNTGAPTSTAEISLGLWDFQGLTGVRALDLEGQTPENAPARYWHSAIVQSYEEIATTFHTLDSPINLDIQLAHRPEIGEALRVSLEVIQKYSLSVLHLALQQPYSDTLQLGWTQPYGSLSYVQGEEVTAKYKLGFDDAAMECVQSYGMSVAATIGQPYASLRFVQNALDSSYKLGFDDAFAEYAQLYGMQIEAAVTQPYESLQFVQNEICHTPYKLGFDDAFAEYAQSYGMQVESVISQPYVSLQPSQTSFRASYKLGFDDASMEMMQPYGMTVESVVAQPYVSLQFVQNEVVHAPYKLGFDEVSGQIEQPYAFMLEAEFTQPYDSLIVVAQQVAQPYTDSTEVAAEVYSPYTLVENDLVMLNLTSHYTMYSSDTVVVVNTSSTLTYKSGYTAALET